MTGSSTSQYSHCNIPCSAGIGLRGPHYIDLIEQTPNIGWLEVHPENYFGAGGPPLHYLTKCRENYPLSLHGVGLSLGSTDPLSTPHLTQLKSLIERYQPGLVSEHLSWGSVNGHYFNDLLPLPYTEESLNHFCQRVEQTQDFLQRRILIENPSAYLEFSHSTIPEAELLTALAHISGCGLLIDVNNLYVTAQNLNVEVHTYLHAIPPDLVGEIHLAGHSVNSLGEGKMFIDDHSSEVSEEVWALFEIAIEHFGPKPSLVEWDSKLPGLATLVSEASKAQQILDNSFALVA